MTEKVSHGAATREPVAIGSRRVRGLWQRRRVDGSLVFEARLRIDGRDSTVVLDARTKSDAVRELEALRVDRDRGETRHASFAPTLDELAEDWLEYLEARVGIADRRRSYSRRTVDLYRQRLGAHVLDRLGVRRVDELTVEDVRRLVDRLTSRGLSPSTVTSSLYILSGLLRFGVKRGAVDRNVVRDLDRDDKPGSERQTEPRYLSASELEALLANMTDTFRPVAASLAFAGLRVSEALGLRWRDVDLKDGTLAVEGQLGSDGERLAATKTRASAATLPLLPRLRRELVDLRTRQASRSLDLVRPDALVFTTSRGRPQSRRNVLRAIHAAGDAASLNADGLERVGAHDLRHSLVANAFEHGLSPAEVAELARHANARVTLTVYAGLTSDGRERASAKLVEGGFGS